MSIREIFLAIIGLFSTNSIIRWTLPDLRNYQELSKILSLISSNISENRQIVLLSFYILLLVVVVVLAVYIMYSIMNIDSIYKDSQRLFVLNRVC